MYNRLVNIPSCFIFFTTFFILVILQQFLTWSSNQYYDSTPILDARYDILNKHDMFHSRRMMSSFATEDGNDGDDDVLSTQKEEDKEKGGEAEEEGRTTTTMIDSFDDKASDEEETFTKINHSETDDDTDTEGEQINNGDDNDDDDDDAIDKNIEHKPPSIPSNIDKNFTLFSTRRPYTQNEKLTVVINTYKQQYCLERMIMLLRSCTDVVAEIRVNWFLEDEEPSFANEYTTRHDIPVIFDRYPDKMSYRFHPRNFTTDAVFSVDVDMFYSCESLDKALYTWHQVENSAVGFHGRKLNHDGLYNYMAPFLSPHFRYNTIFVTKGGITHKDMFDVYFRDNYKHLRDMVDEHVTAEDILMSFILDLSNTQIIMTCPEVQNICMVQCNQGKLRSLVARSSSKRKNITVAMFDYFKELQLPVFKTVYEGEDNVVWQLGQPQEECMSLSRKEYENTPFCAHFCEHNLICPSNVGGT